MKFYEPETIEEAVSILADDPGARCLAGGATLVAMMNARLLEPAALVSLRRIADLRMIERRDGGRLTVGAMARHETIAASPLLTGGRAALRQAAGVIGHPAIRNMGTLGGAICHGDAAADYPAALVAAEATVSAAGPHGTREIAAGGFFVDFLETALEPGEMVSHVSLPAPPRGAVGIYEKFARVEGDFATVSVAVVLAMDDGACSHLRIALGGCGPAPVRSDRAEACLEGTALSTADIARASTFLMDACDPVDDFRGTAAYRLMLVPVLVERAIGKAMQKLDSPS